MANTSTKAHWPLDGAIDYTLGAGAETPTNASQFLDSALPGLVLEAQSAIESTLEAFASAMKESKAGSGSTSETDNSGDSSGTTEITTGDGQKVVDLAKKQEGKPYLWATAGPNTFDCTGLVYYCYKHALGMTLIRHSSDMAKTGKKILGVRPTVDEMKSSIAPGDVVFFAYNNGAGEVHHAGICMGGDSCKFIQAPGAGGKVKETKLTSRNDIACVRRMVKDAKKSDTPASDAETPSTPSTGDKHTPNDTKEPAFLKRAITKLHDTYHVNVDLWSMYKKSAASNDFSPQLFSAIGQHETGSGTAGAGRPGHGEMIFGYGKMNSTTITSLQGYQTQVDKVAIRIKKWEDHLGHHIETLEDFQRLAGAIKKSGDPLHWSPGNGLTIAQAKAKGKKSNPDGWARAVWKIFKTL